MTFRGTVRRQGRRALNAVLKLRAGLALFGENVSPEVPNDLFQAHFSIYHFFARFASRRRVLDLGCGSGYGPALLRRRGAAEVIGVDVDARAVRYARRHFREGGNGLTFLVGDIGELPATLGVFDLVVSSNALEHVESLEAVLDGVVGRLATGGLFIAAVPPIVDEGSLECHRRIRFHRTNLFVWEWRETLQRRFQSVRSFRHLAPDGVSLDVGSPFPSRVDPATFRFEESEPDGLARPDTITAIFVASSPSGLRRD